MVDRVDMVDNMDMVANVDKVESIDMINMPKTFVYVKTNISKSLETGVEL